MNESKPTSGWNEAHTADCIATNDRSAREVCICGNESKPTSGYNVRTVMSEGERRCDFCGAAYSGTVCHICKKDSERQMVDLSNSMPFQQAQQTLHDATACRQSRQVNRRDNPCTCFCCRYERFIRKSSDRDARSAQDRESYSDTQDRKSYTVR